MKKHEYSQLNEFFFNAIQARDFQNIKRLFEEYPEFEINSTDDNGNTLLHIALETVDHNTYPLIQFLLSKGADPMAVNENDKNSFDLVKTLGIKGDIALSILKMHKDQNMKKMLDDINSTSA